MSLNRPVNQPKRVRVNKHQEKLLKNTEEKLQKETERQFNLQNHAAAIALFKMHGWKKDRITNVMIVSKDVYKECGASNLVSMIQLCERETGIDLRRQCSDTDYDDIIYLNCAKDDGSDLNIWQWITMRQNQTKWVPAQITAALLISLHRKERWGAERLIRFLNVMECVKNDYGFDEEEIKRKAKELTGFEILEKII